MLASLTPGGPARGTIVRRAREIEPLPPQDSTGYFRTTPILELLDKITLVAQEQAAKGMTKSMRYASDMIHWRIMESIDKRAGSETTIFFTDSFSPSLQDKAFQIVLSSQTYHDGRFERQLQIHCLDDSKVLRNVKVIGQLKRGRTKIQAVEESGRQSAKLRPADWRKLNQALLNLANTIEAQQFAPEAETADPARGQQSTLKLVGSP